MSILQSEFRQARRGSGQGDMIWERLQNDENFEYCLIPLAVPVDTEGKCPYKEYTGIIV